MINYKSFLCSRTGQRCLLSPIFDNVLEVFANRIRQKRSKRTVQEEIKLIIYRQDCIGKILNPEINY